MACRQLRQGEGRRAELGQGTHAGHVAAQPRTWASMDILTRLVGRAGMVAGPRLVPWLGAGAGAARASDFAPRAAFGSAVINTRCGVPREALAPSANEPL